MLLSSASVGSSTVPNAFELGEEAETELDFPRAVAAYREAIRREPAHPRASWARARLGFLERHAEGEFQPLVALERARRDPADIADLKQKWSAFPKGLVRTEAALLVAETEQSRGDTQEANRWRAAVVEDEGADEILRRLALTQWVQSLPPRELDQARAISARFVALDPVLHGRIARTWRKHWATRLGAGTSLVSSAMGCYGLARSRARWREWVPRPILALSLWIALSGGALARLYASSSSLVFLALGAWTVIGAGFARALRMTGATRALAITVGLSFILAGTLVTAIVTKAGLLERFGM